MKEKGEGLIAASTQAASQLPSRDGVDAPKPPPTHSEPHPAGDHGTDAGKGKGKGKKGKTGKKGKEGFTLVCIDFQYDKCSRGDNCAFLHVKVSPAERKNLEERRDASIARRAQKGKNRPLICFELAYTGKCSNPDCKYSHDIEPRTRGKKGEGEGKEPVVES